MLASTKAKAVCLLRKDAHADVAWKQPLTVMKPCSLGQPHGSVPFLREQAFVSATQRRSRVFTWFSHYTGGLQRLPADLWRYRPTSEPSTDLIHTAESKAFDSTDVTDTCAGASLSPKMCNQKYFKI